METAIVCTAQPHFIVQSRETRKKRKKVKMSLNWVVNHMTYDKNTQPHKQGSDLDIKPSVWSISYYIWIFNLTEATN